MYRTVLYSIVLYWTVQYNTILYSTVQYNAVQYSTIHYTWRGDHTHHHTQTHHLPLPLLCDHAAPVSPPTPPHRSKDQGWSFYILVLLEKNTFERKLRNFFLNSLVFSILEIWNFGNFG